MNYWLWLFVIVPLVIVFGVKPEASVWIRIGRLALAIALGYVLINLALHWSHDNGWAAFDSCQSRFPDGAIQRHKECPDPPESLPLLVYAILGWIPAMGYVALWELLWRWDHRHQIRAMGKAFRGKWISNILFILSIPVWMYGITVIYLIIYFRIINHVSFH